MKICIQTRKILMMRLPEAIARDPLKGRKIISHYSALRIAAASSSKVS